MFFLIRDVCIFVRLDETVEARNEIKEKGDRKERAQRRRRSDNCTHNPSP